METQGIYTITMHTTESNEPLRYPIYIMYKVAVQNNIQKNVFVHDKLHKLFIIEYIIGISLEINSMSKSILSNITVNKNSKNMPPKEVDIFNAECMCVYISHMHSLQVVVKITSFINIFSGNMQHNFKIKKLAIDYLKMQTENALSSILWCVFKLN